MPLRHLSLTWPSVNDFCVLKTAAILDADFF
jgi:hypothetical protein